MGHLNPLADMWLTSIAKDVWLKPLENVRGSRVLYTSTYVYSYTHPQPNPPHPPTSHSTAATDPQPRQGPPADEDVAVDARVPCGAAPLYRARDGGRVFQGTWNRWIGVYICVCALIRLVCGTWAQTHKTHAGTYYIHIMHNNINRPRTPPPS